MCIRSESRTAVVIFHLPSAPKLTRPTQLPCATLAARLQPGLRACNDAKFAKLLGFESGAFCKILGRCQSEDTPNDGAKVMKIEEKVAEYRGNLPGLKDDLEKLNAAVRLWPRPLPVHASARAHKHSCPLPSCPQQETKDCP